MNPYIFVIATVLAIVPLLIIFKVSIERIKEEPTHAGKAQQHFMIGAALSEIIPIIIIIYGFANITSVEAINELYLPGIIVLLLTSVSGFFIFLQSLVDVKEETKQVVTSFTMISLALMTSIPIVSIVGLVLMMP